MLCAYRDAADARGAAASDELAPASTSSNELFNDVIDRAASDIDMLLTDTAYGPLSLCRHPLVQHDLRPRRHHHRDGAALGRAGDRQGRAALRWPPTQATETDEAADAQPGKILHETRGGEMARLGEVPFRRYYGSVDATPLFVMLAGMYLEALGRHRDDPGDLAEHQGGAGLDRRRRRPRRRRLRRICADDRARASPTRAGRTASIRSSTPTAAPREGPIALCEVQAYVFAAKRGRGADGAGAGRGRAAALEREAETLRAALRGPLLARRSRLLRAGARRRTSSPAACAPPMPATPCSPASPARSGRRGWRGC